MPLELPETPQHALYASSAKIEDGETMTSMQGPNRREVSRNGASNAGRRTIGDEQDEAHFGCWERGLQIKLVYEVQVLALGGGVGVE